MPKNNTVPIHLTGEVLGGPCGTVLEGVLADALGSLGGLGGGFAS